MAAETALPADWGVRPVLFHIFGLGVPAYSFFAAAGLAAGAAIYFHEAKRQKNLTEEGFFIFIGALAGGALGAKFLELAINYKYFLAHPSMEALYSGRTIIGGLIGGTLGAMATKKLRGINERRGNLFAPAVAAGVAIGRLGCFCRGCCYGKPTGLPWGTDFGDHIARHPAQLYEAAFMALMFLYLEKVKDGPGIKPGELFGRMALGYFIFRFFIEFVRAEPPALAGLTVFQIISIGAIIYLGRERLAGLMRGREQHGK
jgi:phosphatidylglycerol---prolipoprotein diacylglyceryl transferase